jgi:hypothetical protein
LILVLGATATMLAGCGEFPKDTSGTLDAVRAGRPLRVGWSVAPPWVEAPGAGSSEPAGVEPELVRAFAESIGAKLEWVLAGETQLAEALQANALDIGIGGFSTDGAWAGKVGQTQAYVTMQATIGVAGSTPVPDRWKRVAVRYDRGREDIATALKQLGAEPVPAEPGGDLKPVGAAYEPEMAALGLRSVNKKLFQKDRVIATPPAENALVFALDRFLNERRNAIRDRLARRGAK